MLHSVPPSSPPPILEPSKPADISVGNVPKETDTKTLGNKEKSEAQRQTPLGQTPGDTPTENELSLAKTPSAISQPETFPSEFSPLTASTRAAPLGEQLTIGYPLQQPQGSNTQDRSSTDAPLVTSLTRKQVSQTVTKSKNLSQLKAQLLTQKLAQQKNQNGTTENSVGVEPIQIEFKSRDQTTEQTAPAPPSDRKTEPANTPPAKERIIEVTSDKQVYDEQRRVVTAEGNVVVRFDGTVVNAERLQVSLDNLIAVGEGNVVLTRGDQILRGQRFTYNFVQDTGDLQNGGGDVYVPNAGTDLSFLPTDVRGTGVATRPLSDRIRANQPVQASSPGGINITVGGSRDIRNLPTPAQGGQVRRIRFEAKRIDFYPRGWQARDVRITNDPFSPPELEIRADTVTLTQESPFVDRIRTQRQRLVFDRGVSLPIPKNEEVIDRREREVTPGLFSIGFDGDQRDGVFIERSFKLIDEDAVSLSITPQLLAQRAAVQGVGNVPDLFGLRSKLNVVLSPQTTVQASGVLTSLDLGQVEDNLRASLRLNQTLGTRNPYTLALEYSYRDRLYNGTLGFQTVQSSLGGVISSPVIPLGNSGLNFRYQAGAQYINASSDRQDLLETDRDNNRISLGRVQASAVLDGGITLWQGKPLPATSTEGLRYTANPVVPYLRTFGALTATSSYYGSGDNQSILLGTIGLEGQFGNFSRPFFDYTAFNISYSQGLRSGLSPFLFDRFVDNRVLSAGISQQIYGPFRLGFQTSINLDTGERSSTDYIVEYSRRTYGVTLRYNPVLELGGISFRISDFNWSGGTDPFSDPAEIKPVVGGVRQDN